MMTDLEPRYRLIARSWGPEKSGKDHFWLTGPGPYAKHLFDPGGLEGVATKFKGQKDIEIISYTRVHKRRFRSRDEGTKAQDEAKRQRDDFLDNFERTLRACRSVSVDETEMWEMFRFAEFGEASDAPKNYDLLNSDYREMIQLAVDSYASVQFIQKLKEKWSSAEEIDAQGRKKRKPYATGEYEPVGFKELRFLVQANLSHAWSKELGFVVTVENCRQNMALAGEPFANATFPELAQLVFPESGEQDWI